MKHPDSPYTGSARRDKKKVKRFKSPECKYWIVDGRTRWGFRSKSKRDQRWKELELSDKAYKI